MATTETPNATLDAACASIDAGEFMLPLALFSDPELFELEKERVFARTWNFLAHESEIPEPGDYVLRHIVDDTFIVVRDEEGVVRAHFDACRHRGMSVCRAEMGNASHFRCPYHGWTYKNDGRLIGIPLEPDAYGRGNVDRATTGLLAIPQLQIRNGFIFGNLDPAAPSLAEYMGDYAWYFDFYTDRSTSGLEVLGTPQRWILNSNWKVLAENFMGDAYHSPTSHKSVVEIGLAGVADPKKRKAGIHFNAGGIGAGGLMRTDPKFHGYPPELVEILRSGWRPEHWHLADALGLMPVSGGMFPSLAFLWLNATIEEDGELIPFFTMRTWRPIAADKIEMISFLAVERDAPAWFKEQTSRAYSVAFGSAGLFEQDDAENWSSISKTAKGQLAARHRFNVRMGLTPGNEPIVAALDDWPGPGTAYPVAFAEHNARVFWQAWARQMTNGLHGV